MKLRYLVLLLGVLLGTAVFGYGNAALAQTDNETGNVTANATPAFKDTVLWLYPEYDNPLSYRTPTLLVMLEGEYTGEVPTQVRFLVPTNAGMYSAGSKDAQGVYSGGVPDRKASAIPGWDEISFQLNTSTFRVEYYDPEIVAGFPERTISYDFRTLTPIEGLHAIVQQPRRATGFSANLTGATPTVSTDPEGFTVFSYFLGSAIPESPVHFDIAYTKQDADPSIAGTEPSAAGGGANPALIIGVVAGVVVLAGAAVWLLKSRQSRYVPAAASRAERRRRTRRGEAAPGGRFCTGCGQRINASDRFCPYCGAKTGN